MQFVLQIQANWQNSYICIGAKLTQMAYWRLKKNVLGRILIIKRVLAMLIRYNNAKLVYFCVHYVIELSNQELITEKTLHPICKEGLWDFFSIAFGSPRIILIKKNSINSIQVMSNYSKNYFHCEQMQLYSIFPYLISRYNIFSFWKVIKELFSREEHSWSSLLPAKIK